MNELFMFRAIYEYPKGKKAGVTFVTSRKKALWWAGAFAKSIKGYLLGIEEVRPANIQLRLTP